MFFKKCASEVREVTKKERRSKTRLVTNLGQLAGIHARGTVPKLPNTTFIVVICRVPNSNNNQTSSIQFQALYTDVRHWEELVDFIEKNCSLKEPYYLTALFKWNLTQEELDKEYMGFYTTWQMMNDPLYGQILYNSSL
jgi:hypothetical protein